MITGSAMSSANRRGKPPDIRHSPTKGLSHLERYQVMWRADLNATGNDCAAFLSPRHSDSENALTGPTGVFFDEEVVLSRQYACHKPGGHNSRKRSQTQTDVPSCVGFGFAVKWFAIQLRSRSDMNAGQDRVLTFGKNDPTIDGRLSRAAPGSRVCTCLSK